MVSILASRVLDSLYSYTLGWSFNIASLKPNFSGAMLVLGSIFQWQSGLLGKSRNVAPAQWRRGFASGGPRE